MQQLRSFEFKNVLLLKLYVFPLIGAFVAGPIIVAIIFLLNASLPVLMGATAIGLTVMFAIFKALSKTVTIIFDDDHINFNYDNKTISYLKSELRGFYSFNHFRDATSTVSMCFEFNDGKKIDLSDYLATGKFIREKNEQLKQFLTMAERELGFSAISINKTRKFGKIGSTWFAKAVILILLPALGFAQGVPKAYEAFSYKGILNGHSVQLSLADGYIGASYIISKNIKFQPESNSPDEHHHLKFITNKNNSYFILNNMQEAYGNRPGTITGKYYFNNKAVTIKLNARKLFRNAKYSLSVVSTNIGLNPSYYYINSSEDFFYVETHNCVSLRTSLFAGYFATVNCMRETQLCVSTFKNNRFYSFSEKMECT